MNAEHGMKPRATEPSLVGLHSLSIIQHSAFSVQHWLLILVFVLRITSAVAREETKPPAPGAPRQMEKPSTSHRRFSLPLPTLGGLQFWGDEMIYCGWRIQRSCFRHRYRLIDPSNIRRASGTYEECEEAFRSLVDKNIVRPRSDETVVLLHGLFRSRRSFRGLARHLAEQAYEVVAIEYPSTQASIEKHAAQLARVIGRTDGARQIHFVTHSLGGLVVRCYFRDHPDDERIGRLVMIAPPNRGTYISERMSRAPLGNFFAGPAGRQLAGSNSIYGSLPEPACEFGVIAGGRGTPRGYSRFLPGDDDGVVRVEETRLDGMRDFLIVPAIHTFIMNDTRVKRAVVQFLRTGRFGEGASVGPPAPVGDARPGAL